MRPYLSRPYRLAAVLLTATVTLAACGDSVGPDEGGGVPEGVWNRFGSQFGYETDVAFGGIAGEPANRVYMCELPGSPSAGLYKGTLSDDKRIITWDAQYGLPEYEVTFTRNGAEMDFFVLDGGQKAGQYEKGQWTGNCDLEMASGQLVSTARTAVVVKTSMGGGATSVRINGTSFPMRTETTECSAANAITIPKPTRDDGIIPVSISYSGVGVSGPYSGTAGSSLQYYNLVRGCNKLWVYEGCGAAAYCLGPDPATLGAVADPRLLAERLRNGN
jgi:hypothetical protein